MSDMRTLVSVRSVSKAFGPVQSLADASFELRAGTIHVLLGANAAGKSTLIRLLLGLERPDAGSIDAAGGNALAIGYQPQVPALYEYLTVTEFLDLAARLGRRPHAGAREDLLELFELEGASSQLLRTLSVGTKMKAAIGAAMIQQPDLLVLDEPTNALDAIAVARLRHRLRDMSAAGTTILIATHMLDFAEQLADDITVLRAGHVMYTGPVAALGASSATLESRVLPLIEVVRR